MGRALSVLFGLALAALAMSLPHPAHAETHAVAPAGGGLPALDVRVDVVSGSVDANGVITPIGLPRDHLPDAKDVSVDSVDIGQGRHVLHVRVPPRGGGEPAWEALLAAGQPQPVFAGLTGFYAGDPGERTGRALQILDEGGTSHVLVGDLREDLRICGQAATLLNPTGLYPQSLELRPATVQRLGAAQREGALKLGAKAHGASLDKPLAKLLVARGSSRAGSRGVELTDGRIDSVWYEDRPGMGQGEFVVMGAPSGVPITRVQIVFTPPAGTGPTNGTVPKAFFLVTDSSTFEIAVPEEASHKSGQAYEVVFPQPLATSCVALVLSDAYTGGLAHPDVGVAELAAYGDFDVVGATLDDVAARLSGPRGALATNVLERAGAGAIGAVERAYDRLDRRGRALAVDVAASVDPCESAAPVLARALCETEGEAPRKAREKLERCPNASSQLISRLRDDVPSRACVAAVLSDIAPRQALAPIADALAATSDADGAARAGLRAALGAALDRADPRALAVLAGDRNRSARARLEILRAAGEGVAAAPAEADATLSELIRESPPMRIRYLVLGPWAALARGGDPVAVSALRAAMTGDSDGAVRARAAELAAGLTSVQEGLVLALRDGEPRVREAAFGSLEHAPPPEAVESAMAALSRDDWSFVKTRAIAVIKSAPPSTDADDALGAAMTDPAAQVRVAAVVGLAARKAARWRAAIRKRLDDPNEDAGVRAAAASGLGALCDETAEDRLTELTRPLAGVAADADTRDIALGALSGLTAIHPRNLAQRLAPLLDVHAPPATRAAAQRALATAPTCR